MAPRAAVTATARSGTLNNLKIRVTAQVSHIARPGLPHMAHPGSQPGNPGPEGLALLPNPLDTGEHPEEQETRQDDQMKCCFQRCKGFRGHYLSHKISKC